MLTQSRMSSVVNFLAACLLAGLLAACGGGGTNDGCLNLDPSRSSSLPNCSGSSGTNNPGTGTSAGTLTRTAENGMAAAVAECDGKSKDGLAGVGDMACWYSPKHNELRATKGTTMVIVELKGLDEPTEPAKALMKKVLARLR